MITTANYFYKTALLRPTRTWSPPAAAKTKTVRRPVAPTTEMPASLWRYSQTEEAAQAHHHGVVNRLLLGLVSLSLGVIAYAIHQTYSLMTDNRLHDAIAAFAR